MSKTRANNGMKENLSPTTESKDNLLIGQIYWKGCAYPVREIDTGKHLFKVSVESLLDELINDMRNGIYEAMEACEEIDAYCTDEELRTLSDSELYKLYCSVSYTHLTLPTILLV